MTQIQRDGIGRREFIMLASGTAVAAIAFGDQLLPARAGTGSSPVTFSLGYSDLRSADGGGKVRVSSATTVTSGDGSLISSGAIVSIISSNVSKTSQRNKIYLDAMFPAWVNGQRQLVPYHAWSFDRVAGESSPVSFRVALDMDQRISLSLTAKNAVTKSNGVSRRDLLSPASDGGDVPVVLSITSERETTKLRRGYYFIAPLEAGERPPDWSSYHLRTDAGYKLFDGDTPADFDYIIMRVDAAPVETERIDRSELKRP